jgi:sortase B
MEKWGKMENKENNEEVSEEISKKEKTKKQGKKSKSRKRARVINTICIVCFLAIFLGCAGYLFNYFMQIKKNEDVFEDLRDMVAEDTEETSDEIATAGDAVSGDEFVLVDGKLILKKFEKIYAENNDFMGWITIDGTKIDYPVMQTMEDEEYYINTDFNGNYSSSGTLFIDTSSDVEKPSDVVLIYGHNMKAGNMFHGLLDYEDEDFYQQHKYIKFDTIYGTGTYEVIAAFRDKIYDDSYTGIKYYDFFDAASEADFNAYINYCKSKTAYNISATAVYGEKLICLSTCAYHTTNGRFAVIAKKVD